MNEYEIDDSYFFPNQNEGKFYTISDHKIMYTQKYLGDDFLGDISFTLDTIGTKYEAKVYTILDLIGQMGGIFEMLIFIPSVIVGYIAHKIYEHSLLKILNYNYEKYRVKDDGNEQRKSEEAKSNTQTKPEPEYQRGKRIVDKFAITQFEIWVSEVNQEHQIRNLSSRNTPFNTYLNNIFIPCTFCKVDREFDKYKEDIEMFNFEISVENIVLSLRDLKHFMNQLRTNSNILNSHQNPVIDVSIESLKG